MLSPSYEGVDLNKGTNMDEKTEKNSKIPARCCNGLLSKHVLDTNTGDALTMLALEAAMKEIRLLNSKKEALQRR